MEHVQCPEPFLTPESSVCWPQKTSLKSGLEKARVQSLCLRKLIGTLPPFETPWVISAFDNSYFELWNLPANVSSVSSPGLASWLNAVHAELWGCCREDLRIKPCDMQCNYFVEVCVPANHLILGMTVHECWPLSLVSCIFKSLIVLILKRLLVFL